jgi:hypothetical protein
MKPEDSLPCTQQSAGGLQSTETALKKILLSILLKLFITVHYIILLNYISTLNTSPKTNNQKVRYSTHLKS